MSIVNYKSELFISKNYVCWKLLKRMSESAKRKRFVEAGKLNQFDTKTQKILEEIDKAQNALEEIQQKTLEEIISLEQRNRELRKPWHERRAAYIAQIPNFWATTLLNHPDINVLLDEEEENCLHHLKKLEVEEFGDILSGYYIKFSFDDNPYFENEMLVKEYHLNDEPKCISTNIIWKEGVQPLGETQEASAISPGKKRKMECKSFFKWFRDHTDPLSDDIAEIFKDDLWTNPLQYYLVPDIESNEAGSSPSDSSDIEEPKRKEKTDRAVKGIQARRAKGSTSTTASAVSELSSGPSAPTGSSNENRPGDMGGTCEEEPSEPGNAGNGDSESGSVTTTGGANVNTSRRRMFMGGDYGF